MAGVSLPPLSAGSMRGWILSAPTIKPSTPRRGPDGRHVAAILAGGTTDGWGSTSQFDYAGRPPSSRARPWIPSPRANLLSSMRDEADRFQCTSHAMHQHPGPSPRGRPGRIYSNAPSEMDHPLFGLHDPDRRERLAGTVPSSLNTDTFMKPQRTAYVPLRSDAPYPDTAHHATCFEPSATMGRHQSEARQQFQWPAWKPPTKVLRPAPSLVIE